MFFSHAVIPFSVTTFLVKWSEEFFDVVNAKQNVLMLVRKNVIPQTVATAIEDATDDKAKEILYAHLKDYGNVDTLREYCMAARSANGYPKMQRLAREMLQNLPQGWLCVCMYECVLIVCGVYDKNIFLTGVHVCLCHYVFVHVCGPIRHFHLPFHPNRALHTYRLP